MILFKFILIPLDSQSSYLVSFKLTIYVLKKMFFSFWLFHDHSLLFNLNALNLFDDGDCKHKLIYICNYFNNRFQEPFHYFNWHVVHLKDKSWASLFRLLKEKQKENEKMLKAAIKEKEAQDKAAAAAAENVIWIWNEFDISN